MKNKKIPGLIIGVLLISVCSFSQESFEYKKIEDKKLIEQRALQDGYSFDIGFGMGLDYGGLIGGQIGYSVFKYLDLFGSLGFALANVGWEVGARGYFISKTPKHLFRPYAKAMYGYNAVIIIQGASEYNKTYNGATFGGGIEFRFGRSKKHGFNVDLNIPIRSAQFRNDMDDLKNNPDITDLTDPLPIAISMGYHFEIQ